MAEGDAEAATGETEDKAQAPEDAGEAAQTEETKEEESKETKAENERFMLDFKSRDDAEKSYKEIQSAFTKVAQENAAARAKLEVLERMAKPGYDDQTTEKQKARDKALIDKIESGGSEAILATIRDAALDVVDMTRKERDELRRELLALIEERDPENTAHKETVERLMKEYEIDRPTATKMAKKEFAKKTEVKQPDKPQPPGRTEGKKAVAASAENIRLPSTIEGVIAYLPKESQDAIRKQFATMQAGRK